MIFQYTDMNKQESHCDVEQYGNVVIMTELADNAGASVTHSCEYIASQYTNRFELDLDRLIFVERYDRRSYTNAETLKSDNLSLVSFKRAGSRLYSPQWKHITAAELDVLIEKESATY